MLIESHGWGAGCETLAAFAEADSDFTLSLSQRLRAGLMTGSPSGLYEIRELESVSPGEDLQRRPSHCTTLSFLQRLGRRRAGLSQVPAIRPYAICTRLRSAKGR